MRRYMIEREIQDIGAASRDVLRDAAAKSNAVLCELGPQIQWVESYVTDNRTYCIYLAENEELICRHAEKSRFPATVVREIRQVIDPTTAT
jgi:hypothetical protein